MCVFIVINFINIKFLSNIKMYIKIINYIYNLLLINEQKNYTIYEYFLHEYMIIILHKFYISSA